MRSFHLIFGVFLIFLGACRDIQPEKNRTSPVVQRPDLKMEVHATLNRYHLAAAEARFDAYFGLMADSSVFVGTDPGEHWRKTEFMDYARPYFAKGKAWTMRAVSRHLHFSADSSMVWFEELLETRMKLCRGSGVMSRHPKGWLIEQYILSPTVPNSFMGEVVELKQHYDDSLLSEIMAHPRDTSID